MDPSSCSHCATTPVLSIMPLAILLASLLGSAHCVGMCGGLVLATTKTPKDIAAYHLGRLLAYITLGYFSGYLGHTLFHLKGVPIAMGLGFMLFAVLSLFKKVEFQIPFANQLLSQLMKTKRHLPQSAFAGLVGLGAIFLPCGWLYTFVLAVSQAKDPWLGAGLLAVFWLGTLPAMSLSPLILKRLLNRAGRPISALIYLLVGLGTLWMAL